MTNQKCTYCSGSGKLGLTPDPQRPCEYCNGSGVADTKKPVHTCLPFVDSVHRPPSNTKPQYDQSKAKADQIIREARENEAEPQDRSEDSFCICGFYADETMAEHKFGCPDATVKGEPTQAEACHWCGGEYKNHDECNYQIEHLERWLASRNKERDV